MKLYKLTDENGRTYGGCQWGEGVEHTTSGDGELCGPGWLHAYDDPLIAVLLNPIHANFRNPQLWEAEGEVEKTDNGIKVGCTRLKTIKQILLPEITLRQKVRFAILCAMEVYTECSWVEWAEGWLSGENCSKAAAAAGAADAAYAAAAVDAYAAAVAADAADAATYAAAAAAAAAADTAADTAADAAHAADAAFAAAAIDAAAAAAAAADTAYAAAAVDAYAADAAADAADAAVGKSEFSLIILAKKALLGESL